MSLASIIQPRYSPDSKRHLIRCRLSQDDRNALASKLNAGTDSVRVFKRGRALQLLDEGLTAPTVAEAVDLGKETVRRIARRYTSGGLDKALYEDPRPGPAPTFTQRQEVKIIALVCSKPPAGHDRWTVALIAKEAVSRDIVGSIGQTTVRVMLHRHGLKPWRKKMWCVGELDAEYVCRMEDLLDLYEKGLDPKEPVLCLDEKSIQLTSEVRPPRAMAPGKILRPDYEYARAGVANAFYMVQPKTGKHVVKITESRTAWQFAEMMRDISRSYPHAEKIHIVLDNLNTHCEKSLVDHFGPVRGATLWHRFEVHFTPKHASWLNQAEIGISLYSRECLGDGKRRIADIATLSRESYAWQADTNAARRSIHWTFTTNDARQKFGYSPLNLARVVA